MLVTGEKLLPLIAAQRMRQGVPMNSRKDVNPPIAPGTIFVAERTPLPQAFHLASGFAQGGWAPLANGTGVGELERSLMDAGWTFFYMAGAIQASAFGFDRETVLHTALQRLLAAVQRQKCNCVEIDSIAADSFWGLPHVRISAHSRHIQKGMVFCGQ